MASLQHSVEANYDTEQRVQQAVDRLVQDMRVSEEEARKKLCHEMWRLQESLSRERVEKEKKDNITQTFSDGPSGSEIVVIWGYTESYPDRYPKELMDQLEENRKNFCVNNGYVNFKVMFDKYLTPGHEDTKKAWLKVYAIQDAYQQFPDAKWFFWIDSDAIIVDETADLRKVILNEDVLRHKMHYGMPVADRTRQYHKFTAKEDEINFDEINLIASQDEWFFNAGVMLMRNTKFMKDIIDKQWLTEENIAKPYKYAEQDVLNDLLMENDELFKRWAPVPQSAFNAYHQAYSFGPSKWHKGDFLAHFPGESKKEQLYIDTWKKYWDERVTVESTT